MPGPITLAVEGIIDLAVAKRLLHEAGLRSGAEYVKSGKGNLDQRLAGYNTAARFSCWLVLRDLDRDAACAPELRLRLLPDPAVHMRIHIPVRAVEAWLLADADAISRSLSIAAAIVPTDPEAIVDPKHALIDLARRSRRRAIRDALVAALATTAKVGPGYAAFLIEFAAQSWRPAVASRFSQSLARLRDALRAVSQRDAGSP